MMCDCSKAVREARKAALEEAATLLRKISADIEADNDEFARMRLPGVACEPECSDLAWLMLALQELPAGCSDMAAILAAARALANSPEKADG